MPADRPLQSPPVVRSRYIHRHSRIRVPAHREEMEKEHRESEPIVLHLARTPREIDSLKFRRCPDRRSHRAAEDAAARAGHLIRIAIDETHQPIAADKHVALVHGEPKAQKALCQMLKDKGFGDVVAPEAGQIMTV